MKEDVNFIVTLLQCACPRRGLMRTQIKKSYEDIFCGRVDVCGRFVTGVSNFQNLKITINVLILFVDLSTCFSP